MPHVIRPLPDDFAERAPGMTRFEIMREWKIGSGRCSNWLARIGDSRPLLGKKATPEGFAELVDVISQREMAERFGLSRHDVSRMCRELGHTPRPYHAPRPVPDGFAAIASQYSTYGLATRYKCCERTVRRWLAETGTRPRPPRFFRDGQLQIHAPISCSVEDLAANHLRRLCAVYRCRDDGRADPSGEHWRVGNVVLTGVGLMQRAERKGFKAPALRDIAA